MAGLTACWPSAVSGEQQEVLNGKLNGPSNGLAGFVELKAWFDSTFGMDISYKTLNGYVRRRFGASANGQGNLT